MIAQPKLTLTDIIHFHDTVLNKSDLIQRIDCKHKEGKAYRYYTNSFIGQVMANLNDNSS